MAEHTPFFDCEGNPTDLHGWIAASGRAMAEGTKHVGDTRLDGWRVSTIWIGLDIGDDVPLIFETMIFTPEGVSVPDMRLQWRWPTRAAALAGHDRAVAALRVRLRSAT